MQIVNETHQEVIYVISYPDGPPFTGIIPVNGLADLPDYDNKNDVQVQLSPTSGNDVFSIVCKNTGTGQQVEMALVVG